jgi:hypothetical protein
MQTRLYALVALFAGIASNSGGPWSPASSQRDCCAVLELRQYTLKPGQRDVLIALFDRHFIESQEAVGMTIVGQFRDRRRSDRFVWIRGFSDMRSRHAALEKFYGGPVWTEHKAAANQTMLDVDDVRLLKPARPSTAFRVDVRSRPAIGDERKTAMLLVGIHRLRQPADASVVSTFEEQVVPELRRDGVLVEAVFVTESAPNTFTRLPVREGEHLLVWFATLQRGDGPGTQRLQEASAAFGSLADEPLQVLELEATPRSLLGHHRAGR